MAKPPSLPHSHRARRHSQIRPGEHRRRTSVHPRAVHSHSRWDGHCAQPNPATRQQAQTGRGQGRSGRGGYGANGGRGGRNAQPGQPGFTNVNVTATEAGAQEIAAAGSEQMADLGVADPDDLTIGGSISGGLQQASDDQQRLNRMAGRGGPGGPGGPGDPAAPS